MSTNYYLIIKENYNEKSKYIDFQELNNEVVEIKNGYIYNNYYYQNLDELNKCFAYKLHIGKSSYGWHFSLCIYPELNINNLDDWKKLFKENIIKAEYGDIVSYEEMLSIITERSMKNWNVGNQEKFEQDYIINSNSILGTEYSTYDEFLKDNSASRGLNGLLRHKSNDYFSWNYTNGTYDLTLDWSFS